MTGVSFMRLFLLLGLLGLGAYGLVAGFGPTAPAPRAERPATQTAPAQDQPEVSRAAEAPGPRALPPAVRRLADQPVTGPARPVILQDAVIDPTAVQPMQALHQATAAAVATGSAGTIRRVTANSVNVRGGPSTQNPVVGRLTRGEEVEVLATDPSGWVQVRLQGDGVEGWVSGRLLGP